MMKESWGHGLFLLAALSLLLFLPPQLFAQAGGADSPMAMGGSLSDVAVGTFEVSLSPLEAYDDTEGSILGRMSMDKVFSGDLAGVSKGEMLTAMTEVQGSAGYVALERVEGTLHGRRGSFVLQHSGTMSRGSQELSLTVVPDSGTGELEGLAGSMSIDMSDGHAYELEYTLESRDEP